MVFILFEKKNICSLCCFLFDKNSLGSSRDIVLLLHSLLNICYSFYFPIDFPGLNIKSFQDLV